MSIVSATLLQSIAILVSSTVSSSIAILVSSTVSSIKHDESNAAHRSTIAFSSARLVS